MSDTTRNQEPEEKEVDLFDYLNVLIKHRRMILRNTFLTAAVVLLVSFLLPRTYTAVTTLLPPDEGPDQGLRSLLANAPISVLNLPGTPASTSEIFVEILKSRSVAQGVLRKKYHYKNREADLLEIWDLESLEEAMEKLRKRSRIFANEQGIISVSVELRDPKLAAEVANAFTAELDRVNQEKSLSKAKNSRIYIEEQLKKTQESLKRASQALADFQSKYKAVDLEEQTKITIEKAGEIKGTILAKEVELEVLRQTMKQDNPVVVRLQKELDELRKQFDHLQFGNAVPFEQQRDYFIPPANVPEVGLRLAELVREVKVQETVWQLLNQQYYSAKIQEARDTPTVQVLDEAVPPERKTKPRRRLLVLVASFLMFSFSAVFAFLLEYHERIKRNESEFRKVNHLIEEVKKDYQQIKRIFEKGLGKLRKK